MHGIIFDEIRAFANEKMGEGGWEKLLDAAGLSGKSYEGIQAYPDEEAVALVGAAADALGASIPEALEVFGTHIVPPLASLAAPLLDPDWRTVDVIHHTEDTVHAVVRLDNPGAEPPQLRTERISAQEVHLTYSSGRKMCHLAVGIAKGLAAHFGETITITHDTCMHQGDDHCLIKVRSE